MPASNKYDTISIYVYLPGSACTCTIYNYDLALWAGKLPLALYTTCGVFINFIESMHPVHKLSKDVAETKCVSAKKLGKIQRV